MNKRKFKVGDKVKIHGYTNIPFGTCCKDYFPIGSTQTIKMYVGEVCGQPSYLLAGDNRFSYRQDELVKATCVSEKKCN